MTKSIKQPFPDRPETPALITAIEDVIDEIAPGKMTPVEVVGVLEVVKAGYLSAIGGEG